MLIYYNDTVNLLILLQTTHTQKTAEGDGRRQGSKVDKDNCSKNLGVQSICDVTLVVLVASFYVPNHSTKRTPRTGQRVLCRRFGGEGHWEETI